MNSQVVCLLYVHPLTSVSLWLEWKAQKGVCSVWSPTVTPASEMLSDTPSLLSKYEWMSACEGTRLEKAGGESKTQNRKGGDVERAEGRGPRSQEAGDPA